MKTIVCGESEEKTNGGCFDNWGEGVGVINTGDLVVALCNESSFVSRRGSFWVLEFENEFCADDFPICWTRYDVPGAVLFEGFDFGLHGC
jgi:hypothetical protein